MLGMTIKMSRCNLTSKQELEFWGPNAAQFNRGCPCNKREATIMAKRNCEGCGRTVYGKRWCNNCRPDGKEKGEEGKETMAPKKKVEKAGLLTTEEFCKQVDEVAAKHPALPDNGDKAPEPKEGDRDKNGKLMKRCRICNEVKVHHGQGLCSGCFWRHVKKPANAAARKNKQAALKEVVSAPIPIDLVLGPPLKATVVLEFRDEVDLGILDYIDKEAKRCRRTPEQQVLWILQSHLPEMNGREAA
jgi:hypothetical protein